MMKIFVSNNVVLFILVVTTTIDASRIFYLPLPKIHSSHQQIQTPKIIEKPTSDEFIPQSVIEQEEIEKRGDNFDWAELMMDQETAKRRIMYNELLSESLDEPREIEASIDDPGIVHTAIERVERLQSNAELNSSDRKKTT